MNSKKLKTGYLQAFLSILLNIFLFVIKYIAGIRSGSIALIADAWHTLSDCLSSLILFFGFKLSGKPADKEHPFGHGRAELLAALVVGIILILVGINFMAEALQRLQQQRAADFGLFALIVILISILLKEILAQFAIRLGKKYDSALQIADGWHHRSDALSSLLILVGITLGKHFWWIDGVLGIIVALFIFYSAYEVIRSPFSILIGERPSEEQTSAIIEAIKSNITIPIHLHHLHVHKYGDHLEVTFHIELDPKMSLAEAHSIADQIEIILRTKLNMEATIHLEPQRSEKG